MSERIVTAAAKLVACIQAQRATRDQINWQACELYDEGDPETGYPTIPCVFREDKTATASHWEDFTGRVTPDKWCAVCVENYRLRGEWARLGRQRSGYLRSLERAVNAHPAPSTRLREEGEES